MLEVLFIIVLICLPAFIIVRFVLVAADAGSSFEIYGRMDPITAGWMGVGFAVRNFFRLKHRMINPFKAFGAGFGNTWKDLEELKHSGRPW
jgi:hypothetical protein